MKVKLSWEDIARGGIERHLGDCFDGEEDPTPDAIFSEAYTLAFDALHNAGCPIDEARRIAQEQAQNLAQP